MINIDTNIKRDYTFGFSTSHRFCLSTRLTFRLQARGFVRFYDIAYFYANVIDYVRVVMCLVAAFTIRANWPVTSAFLIFVSVLLDWIDGPLSSPFLSSPSRLSFCPLTHPFPGPVARAYNQCTIFGSGVDWLADVLCQVITMGWWVQLDPSTLPWCVCLFSFQIFCFF